VLSVLVYVLLSLVLCVTMGSVCANTDPIENTAASTAARKTLRIYFSYGQVFT
jgi:hypothetical protein